MRDGYFTGLAAAVLAVPTRRPARQPQPQGIPPHAQAKNSQARGRKPRAQGFRGCAQGLNARPQRSEPCARAEKRRAQMHRALRAKPRALRARLNGLAARREALRATLSVPHARLCRFGLGTFEVARQLEHLDSRIGKFGRQLSVKVCVIQVAAFASSCLHLQPTPSITTGRTIESPRSML